MRIYKIFFLLLLSLVLALFVIPSVSEECNAEPTRATYGVVLSIIDQPYFPNDGKWTGFINITVENTSPDKDDTFSLEATAKSEGWDVIILEPTIDVGTSPPTGPRKCTSALVTCPYLEEEGDYYRITIKGTSQGDHTRYHSINIDIQVMLVPLVDVEGPVNVEDTDIDPANGIPDYLEGDPGDYITYDFRIRNEGNGEESYFISLESPNNWWHEIQGPSFTQSLGRNQTTIKRVKVKIPEDAEKGDSDVLKFIATSQCDPNRYKKGEVETRVKQVYQVSLEAPIYSTYSYPRSEVELDFNITNQGNGPDRTVRVEMSSIPDGWLWELDLSNIGETGIKRYDKGRCVLSIIVPETALNMTYSVTIEAYSSLKIKPDSEVSFNITVFQEFDLGLFSGARSIKASPGDQISYNFTIGNTGNGKDTFSIELLKVGENDITPWCDLDIDSIELGDGFSKEILFNILIPPLTKAGDYSFWIRAVSLGAQEMQLVITEEIIYTFGINKQYALDLAIQEGEGSIIINSDEALSEDREEMIHFNVTNLGNTQDIVLFTIDFPEEGGWSSPDFMISQAMLQYQETRGDLILTTKAPHRLPIGEYHFTINVVSKKDPSDAPAGDTASFTVKIVRYDIDIEPILYLDSHLIESGINVTHTDIHKLDLKIRIRNVGNLFIDRFNVSLYVNDERITPLKTREIFDFAPGAEKELSFDFTPGNYGDYNLILLADSDGTISESNENNNRVDVIYKLNKPLGNDEEEEARVSVGSYEFSLLEFIILALGIVVILVLVAVLVIRLSRLKKVNPLVDTGLVEGGEYKFKERASKPKFDGLELDDFFDDMEEGMERIEEDIREEIKKDKGTGYYVTGQPAFEAEGTGTGFRVLKSTVETFPGPREPSRDYTESDLDYFDGEGIEEEFYQELTADVQPIFEDVGIIPEFGESLLISEQMPPSRDAHTGEGTKTVRLFGKALEEEMNIPTMKPVTKPKKAERSRSERKEMATMKPIGEERTPRVMGKKYPDKLFTPVLPVDELSGTTSVKKGPDTTPIEETIRAEATVRLTKPPSSVPRKKATEEGKKTIMTKTTAKPPSYRPVMKPKGSGSPTILTSPVTREPLKRDGETRPTFRPIMQPKGSAAMQTMKPLSKHMPVMKPRKHTGGNKNEKE